MLLLILQYIVFTSLLSDWRRSRTGNKTNQCEMTCLMRMSSLRSSLSVMSDGSDVNDCSSTVV